MLIGRSDVLASALLWNHEGTKSTKEKRGRTVARAHGCSLCPSSLRVYFHEMNQVGAPGIARRAQRLPPRERRGGLYTMGLAKTGAPRAQTSHFAIYKHLFIFDLQQ